MNTDAEQDGPSAGDREARDQDLGTRDFAAIGRFITGLPQFRALGLHIIAITAGRCTMAFDQRPELMGDTPRGVLHGGVITTLLDSVAGTAVYTLVADTMTVATLDLRIDYLHPSRSGERVYGEAEVYRRARNVCFVSGTAYQADRDEPIARCSASFMLGSVGFAPSAGRGDRQAP